jgi:hypothetical protein
VTYEPASCKHGVAPTVECEVVESLGMTFAESVPGRMIVRYDPRYCPTPTDCWRDEQMRQQKAMAEAMGRKAS